MYCAPVVVCANGVGVPNVHVTPVPFTVHEFAIDAYGVLAMFHLQVSSLSSAVKVRLERLLFTLSQYGAVESVSIVNVVGMDGAVLSLIMVLVVE